MSALPPGFVLDATPNEDDVAADEYGSPYRDARVPVRAKAEASAALPPGFVLDKPAPDKYQQAAIEDARRLAEIHAPQDTGYLRRIEHGMSLGADTTLMAAARTPAEMIKHGTISPVEGYNYAKAREELELEQAQKNTGALGTAAEILGGAGSAIGLLKAGVTTGRLLAPNASRIARTVSAGADAAGYGGFTGTMEGNGIEERAKNALRGAAYGSLLGTAAHAGAGAIGAALAPSARTPVANAVADAADRLGMNFPRIATSDSLLAQRAGSALKEIPFLGDPLVKASRAANEQIGQALTQIEQGYGSGSALNAGEVAKEGIADWITGKSADVSKRLYDNLDRYVKPNVATDLAATRDMIGRISAEREAAGLGASKAVQHVLDAVQRPDGMLTQGVKTLRTSIGEMLDNSLLPADIRKSELKRIYGALSDDLAEAVYNSGLRARNGRFQRRSLAPNAFEKANSMASMIADRREQLARIVGTDASAAPERVLDRLIGYASGGSRADANKLLLPRKAIGGENWDEIASGAVSKMGRDVDGKFSPERFISAYGKISPRGKQLLFGSTGRIDLAKALEDVATLSRRAKELNSFGNPSGTGRVLGGLSTVGALITHPHLAIPAVAARRRLWTPSAMQLLRDGRSLVRRDQDGPSQRQAAVMRQRRKTPAVGTECKLAVSRPCCVERFVEPRNLLIPHEPVRNILQHQDCQSTNPKLRKIRLIPSR